MMRAAAVWLRAVAASAHADRLVVRGSLVTGRLFPTRVAEDVDHLVTGACDVDAAKALARDVAGTAAAADGAAQHFVVESQEIIWADTPFPGVRTHLRNRVSGGGGADSDEALQVDLGWGDPLTLAPERVSLLGATVLAARPESMVAWKLHGLVELGPRGRWRPKDLYDLDLFATIALRDQDLALAIATAFGSRGDGVALLDSFVTDATWGTSRGSRHRWKTLRRAIPGAPDLADAIARVRARFAPAIRAAATSL